MRETTSSEIRQMRETTSLEMSHLNDKMETNSLEMRTIEIRRNDKMEAIREDSHRRIVPGETTSPSVQDPESGSQPNVSRPPSKRRRE